MSFIFGVLIAIVERRRMSGNLQPLFGMMIAVWVFYMAFEAYHTAKRRQLGQPVDEFSSIVPRARTSRPVSAGAHRSDRGGTSLSCCTI